MKEVLSGAKYAVDPETRVWARPGYQGIAYSDGDEVEDRIERVIEAAQDRALFSDDLRAACVDWPLFYHLSSCRPNILRPFEDRLKGAAVLEVGAGCGAITRYLGEQGADVLALEGSLRRARIARKRTRDLTNVEVLAESFEEFQVERQFDVVTVIGVLEYAPQFITGADPVVAMLQRIRGFLKPGGLLIVAIENKLGLKYFAGAPEDHLGVAMYGIESRYRAGQPVTFGYRELCALLERAGFAEYEFMSPLPDYKAAVSIITETGFSAKDFDPAALARVSVERDRQLPQDLGFSMQRAWKAVTVNTLGLDLANSFLVAATLGHSPIGDETILAYHYNSNRIPRFCKSTIFRRTSTGEIVTQYERLSSSASVEKDAVGISMVLPNQAPYIPGVLLSEVFSSLFEVVGWSIEDVVKSIHSYLVWMESQGCERLLGDGRCIPSAQIPGRLFDLIPSNVVVNSPTEWHAIDSEWECAESIPLDWFIFRILIHAIATTAFFERSGSHFENSREGFVLAVFSALGFKATSEHLRAIAEQEAHIQTQVLGAKVPGDFWQPRKQLSGLRNAFDKAQHLEYILGETRQELCSVRESLQEKISHHESALRQQQEELSLIRTSLEEARARIEQQSAELGSKTGQLAQVRAQLQGILESRSWRITAPLRGFTRLGKMLFSLTSR